MIGVGFFLVKIKNRDMKNTITKGELEQHVKSLLGRNRECLRVIKDVYDVYYYDTDNEIEKELFEDLEKVWDKTLNEMIEVITECNYVKKIEEGIMVDMRVMDDYTHHIYLPKRNGKWLKIDSENKIEIVDDEYR
jgi:hypothetical protein